MASHLAEEGPWLRVLMGTDVVASSSLESQMVLRGFRVEKDECGLRESQRSEVWLPGPRPTHRKGAEKLSCLLKVINGVIYCCPPPFHKGS